MRVKLTLAEVIKVMLLCLRKNYGNPSSIHTEGRNARRLVDGARLEVARLLNAHPDEIIFTSGGTESNNQAIRNSLQLSQAHQPHLITSAIEHQTVLQPAQALVEKGCCITSFPVDGAGRIDPTDCLNALKPNAFLVSVMLANNDIGTIQPRAQLSHPLRERGILLHTDAVQCAGKYPLDAKQLAWIFFRFQSINSTVPKAWEPCLSDLGAV